jgi:hypothetical protein
MPPDAPAHIRNEEKSERYDLDSAAAPPTMNRRALIIRTIAAVVLWDTQPGHLFPKRDSVVDHSGQDLGVFGRRGKTFILWTCSINDVTSMDLSKISILRNRPCLQNMEIVLIY